MNLKAARGFAKAIRGFTKANRRFWRFAGINCKITPPTYPLCRSYSGVNQNAKLPHWNSPTYNHFYRSYSGVNHTHNHCYAYRSPPVIVAGSTWHSTTALTIWRCRAYVIEWCWGHCRLKQERAPTSCQSPYDTVNQLSIESGRYCVHVYVCGW